ncbi:TM0106 family RecB-like putative nuclease [Microvirga tunisiensis]|uniref:TM0106 family RecB-like putative nuclease n=2 Tax=Microvirga tunisiensis TaxID=2108360 RepID=A0A5N7MV32_9HYPH|nr:TM0106 family RecB-like putative nuclease [Microvirga tunisiensis]
MKPHMPITDIVFQAYLQCEMKAFLLLDGAAPSDLEIENWQHRLAETYKTHALKWLCASVSETEIFQGMPSLRALRRQDYCLPIGPEISLPEIQARPHAVERVPVRRGGAETTDRPIRFSPSEKLSSSDRLLAAFDALALSRLTGRTPATARIIHGSNHTSTTVQLTKLIRAVRSLVDRFKAQYATTTPTPLALNKHCSECQFRSHCRQIALEKDDLSLLTTLREQQRKKLNRKGITTVAQLSCTYRPRRRSARNRAKATKHEPALKALAIHANRIHVVDTPTFAITSGAVYLDVEGVPDREFYYLIGMRYRSGDEDLHLSFWADDLSDECEMWRSFVRALSPISDVRLFHYGSYETQFLKRMKERYCEIPDDIDLVDRLIATSTNLLSLTYAHIYFPTHSNGLKDIAGYLGFCWSEADSSGLHALIWRSEWEATGDPSLKQKLIIYNAEDCEAAQRVAEAIAEICAARPAGASSEVSVNVNALEHGYRGRFGPIQYAISDFKPINEAAYWDYQRQRVYVRSDDSIKRLSRRSAAKRPRRENTFLVVEPRPERCSHCGSGLIYKHGPRTKVGHDLKLTRIGIRLLHAKFSYPRYRCRSCGRTFSKFSVEHHGRGLRSYVIYHLIELRISNRLVSQSLNDIFGLRLGHDAISRIKTAVAYGYSDAYRKILQRIVNGPLIHADETQVIVDGKVSYVWVFTSFDEVAYIYSESRDSSTLHEVLDAFQGVLVSDFYAAYDSVECVQQKCLIHLMRDLNDDLMEHPYNEEMQEIANEFGLLLRSIVETIDRFGLKARYLRKHRKETAQFFDNVAKRDFQSEVAVGYKSRFGKCSDKMFTFLNYDNVPWNNNNAEHAIKAFARLRNVIGGSSTPKGMRDYLVLLSISEICKYKGLSFLDFLRSGETDVDAFAAHTGRARRTTRTPNANRSYSPEFVSGPIW